MQDAGLVLSSLPPGPPAGVKHSTKNVGEGEAQWLYGYA